MKINTSTDYAIRILICLAKAGHVVSSSQLSQDLNISSRYVLLVLAKLQNAGMVNAAYGCAGGYTLAYDPGEISIQNVIHVMEGIHLIESSENSMFAIYINNYNSLPSATADLGELIRQLQEQPGLASTLAQLLNGAVQGTTG